MAARAAKATEERAGSPEHRARLAPLLAQLEAGGGSVFLDLCELTLMLSERIDGMIKWEHPRVTVHIKMKRRVSTKKDGTATAAKAEAK